MQADHRATGRRPTPVPDQVLDVAALVFGVPRRGLTPGTAPQDVATWDSLNHLALILALEQRFGLQLPPEDTDQMRTLRHVIDIVERRLMLNRTTERHD